MQPPISIADVLRAYARLRPGSPSQKAQIAAALGFGAPSEPSETSELGVPAPEQTPEPAENEPDEAIGPLRSHKLKPSKRLGLMLRGPVGFESPEFLPPGDTLLLEKQPERPPVAHPALFVPGWTRAILSTALAREAPIGAVDVEAVVRLLARAEPLMSVPRLSVAAMAPCVQVLLDVGGGMLPFADDQRQLIDALRLVAGKSAVECLSYVGVPLTAGKGRPSKWRAFEPVSRSALLILGDLGCAPGALDAAPYAAWSEFLQIAKQRGCSVTTLVPYPASRWPRRLARLLRPLHWDRSTRVGRIKASARS